MQQRNWRKLGVQVGLLAGVGLAFVIGGREQAVAGEQNCFIENQCTYRKPNIMFIVDYSTSMNVIWDIDANRTSWEVVVDMIKDVAAPGSFISQNAHLALMRYGHDPDPGAEGTTIPNDASGLVDGVALDLAWDDANNVWYECAGQLLVDALDATPPPLMGQSGIGAWTKGALERATQEILQTRADHVDDDEIGFPRTYANVLLTQAVWTNDNGTMTLAPPEQDPGIAAQELFEIYEVPTYVVAFPADAQGKAIADQLAGAGGTAISIDGGDTNTLGMALQALVQDIIGSLIAPECESPLPRVMILLDASSAMLNVDGGAGAMGQTGWDLAREALVGRNSLFDVEVNESGKIADLAHFGLAVFGHDMPGEQKLLVQYGPCMKDNFEWALDPQTSCVNPGCEDPWGGPPITWTFMDGTQEPPGFDQATTSHMPKCDGATLCSGSGSHVHLGLQLIKDNQIQYHMEGMLPPAQYPTSPATRYLNILLTEGRYDGYSTDAQVQAELEAMHSSDIITYVVGIGDGADAPEAVAQLEKMADWGSGGTLDYFDANSQAELEAVLADIFSSLRLDPCCAIRDCSFAPEPTTFEPDPIPPWTDDGGDGGDGDGGDGDGGDGDRGDGDRGDGDRGDGDGEDEATLDSDGESTGDGDGDEEGEDDGPVAEDGDTGESGADPSAVLNDRGCSCRTADGKFGGNLLGTGLLLGLLGLVRRRERAGEIGR